MDLTVQKQSNGNLRVILKQNRKKRVMVLRPRQAEMLVDMVQEDAGTLRLAVLMAVEKEKDAKP